MATVLERIEQHAERDRGRRARRTRPRASSPTRPRRSCGTSASCACSAPKPYGGYESHPAEWAEAVMRPRRPRRRERVARRHRRRAPVGDRDERPRRCRRRSGARTRTSGSPRRTPRWAMLTPTDGGYTLQRPLAVLVAAPTTASGSTSARSSATRTASRSCRRRWCTCSSRDRTTRSCRTPGTSSGSRAPAPRTSSCKGAHVPDYRVLELRRPRQRQGRQGGRADQPALPRAVLSGMFPLGITSAVIGIAEGALAHHLAYQRTRVQVTGTKIKDDPYVLTAIGEAAAEIHAARVVLLDNVNRLLRRGRRGREYVLRRAGRQPPQPGQRARGAPSVPSTRSSRVPAATACAWTTRCSASGATRTWAWPTRSTCPARSTTSLGARHGSATSRRPVRCAP